MINPASFETDILPDSEQNQIEGCTAPCFWHLLRKDRRKHAPQGASCYTLISGKFYEFHEGFTKKYRNYFKLKKVTLSAEV